MNITTDQHKLYRSSTGSLRKEMANIITKTAKMQQKVAACLDKLYSDIPATTLQWTVDLLPQPVSI